MDVDWGWLVWGCGEEGGECGCDFPGGVSGKLLEEGLGVLVRVGWLWGEMA